MNRRLTNDIILAAQRRAQEILQAARAKYERADQSAPAVRAEMQRVMAQMAADQGASSGEEEHLYGQSGR